MTCVASHATSPSSFALVGGSELEYILYILSLLEDNRFSQLS